MRATRRGFFGIFGGAVLGGKKAAANAAATLAGGLDKLNVAGAGHWSDMAPGIGAPYDEDATERINDPTILKAIGIPEWLRDEWREETSTFSAFDPDIACLNSFSLSAKINLQKERNLAKYEQDFWRRGYRRQESKLWRKLNGAIGWW